MTDSPSDSTFTKDELRAARDIAMARLSEIVQKSGGTNHQKGTFVNNANTLARSFLGKNKGREQLSVREFFDFLNKSIAPTRIAVSGAASGQTVMNPEDRIREYNAAAEQLLNALGLKQQFVAYKHSLKSKAVEGRE